MGLFRILFSLTFEMPINREVCTRGDGSNGAGLKFSIVRLLGVNWKYVKKQRLSKRTDVATLFQIQIKKSIPIRLSEFLWE